MDWCRLGTSYYHDPAILRAGEAAEVLFLRCLAYSGSVESRGRIDKAVLPLLTPVRTKARVDALVREQLLIDEGETVLIRKWEHWQEALDVEAERRRRDRERKRAERDAVRAASSDVSTDSPRTVQGKNPRKEVEVEEEKDKSGAAPPQPIRSDVEGLCRYFLEAIARNGVRATISDRWRTEARLMLDRDQRDPSEIRAVIDWSTTDSFWRANVLSVPKLREKYHQLRLGMERAHPQAISDDPHKEHLAQW